MTSIAIGSRIQQRRHPVDQLVKELDTDWFPDPWRWAIPDLASEEPIKTFEVPFPGGAARTVPVIELAQRMRFAWSAADVVRNVQGSLSEGVFGFGVAHDGTFRHYRDELRLRAAFEQATAEHMPFVASTDVRSFFRTVTIEHVDNALRHKVPSDSLSELIVTLSKFTDELGYPLPEGHGASRGVASLVLLPVDQTIEGPFARWLDDYRVFAQSYRVAADGLARLVEALGRNGFTVAPEKTVIDRYQVVNERYAASLADHTPAETPTLAQTLNKPCTSVRGWEKTLRLALRTAADHPRTSDLDVLKEHRERIPAIAYPRLAWMLFQHKDNKAAWSLLLELLHSEGELRNWRLLRLLPLLWYLPNDVAREAAGIVEEAIIQDGPLRLLAARVAAKQIPSVADGLLRELSDREQVLVAFELKRPAQASVSRALAKVDAEPLRDALAGPPVHSYL